MGAKFDPLLAALRTTDVSTNTGGDKYFAQPFTNATTIAVAHNLAKLPSVTVLDSSLTECEGQVVYIDNNNLTITFSASFSGTVTCN